MWKKFLSGLVIVGMFLTGLNTVQANTSNTDVRATWLWDTAMIVHDEAGTLAFLESKQINKVYLQINRDIPISTYQRFIEKAGKKGMHIYALDGAPDWVAPKGDRHLDQLMNWVSRYQMEATGPQKFAGVHLDVEPYLYSGWRNKRASTIQAYQSLLVKGKRSAASMGIPLKADIPFWFDEVSYNNTFGKGNLAEWVIMNTDSVTIMAYRDTAPMILSIVAQELAFAKKHGKTAIVGVETMKSAEGNFVTFHEEGETYMNEQLALVKQHYAGATWFGGVAIHHVGSWMQMKR